ncbi:MAG: putative ABC transporter permease [Clostridiales bacterium]|nr:putative ABC transporter permease [Clostridiales bacterium]
MSQFFSFLPFPFVDSMIMFFIYGVVGWVVEVIYYGITEGKFINRGFLNGPLCPVYGIGFYGVIWFFLPFLNNFPVLFFGSALVCTIVELIAGVVLYWIFHLRWWDYSDYRFNFHGFICVRFSIYWGIACSLGMFLLHPAVMKVISFMNRPVRLGFVFTFSSILIIDIIVSVFTIIGFNKKVAFISGISGGIRKSSDYVGSKIYDTVDTIVTKTTPAVNATTTRYAEFTAMYGAHRTEEKELAAKHRAEERELLASYMSTGKETFAKTRDAAGKKIRNTFLRLAPYEVKMLGALQTNTEDENEEIIRYLKEHFDDNFPVSAKEDDPESKDSPSEIYRKTVKEVVDKEEKSLKDLEKKQKAKKGKKEKKPL